MSNLVGAVTLLVIFAINALSAALGGVIQNAAMLIKLIPLAIIAFAGLFFGDSTQIIANDVQSLPHTIQSSSWIAAFAPIAFSFDGWSVATTICHEIKNSKRNLPIAMIVAPIAVLLCYLLYFVGITSLVGVDTVMEQGNESVYTAANQVFGAIGAKLILVFVVISIIGTLNGLTLAFIQLPYSLAIRNMMPGSKQLTKMSKRFGHMPVYSALFALALSMIWLGINYLTQKAEMIGDVSEVPIGLSYVMFILLYVTVIRLGKKGEVKGVFMAYVVPSLAIVGSLIIVAGTVTHPSFWLYVIVAVVICGLGYYYGGRTIKTAR
jgi:APA family basic amino acid/polyamine antiporter